MKAPHHTTTLQGFPRAHFSHVCLWIAMGSRRVSSAVLPICNTPPSGARHHVNRGTRCHTRSSGRNGEDPSPLVTLPPRASAAMLPCCIPDDHPTSRGAARSWEFPQSRRKANIPPGEPPATCAFSRVKLAALVQTVADAWPSTWRLVGRLRRVEVVDLLQHPWMTWRELSTMAKSSGIQFGEGSPRPRSCFLVPAAFRARRQDPDICALVRSCGLAVGANSGH